MKTLIAVAAVAAAIVQVPAHAQDLDSLLNNVDFSFGGYGTAGIVRTDTDRAQFVRSIEKSGATQSPRESTDSNLGVQATARFNSWLSATVQVLASSNELTDVVSWAYLKIDPVDNLSFKLGKVEMPLFAISDSRDINYANVWLRAPNEVYSLANMEELRGGEFTYSLPIGSTHLSLTGYAGNSTVVIPIDVFNAWDVHGGELRWETEWVTLRAGLATAVPELGPGLYDRYTFYGFGALVDHDNIIAQAEYVRRKADAYTMEVNSTGYYVLGGYRFGKVAPYVSYASTTKSQPYYAPYALSLDQDTAAVGVRWDAFKSADIKFQFERVDPKGTAGISFTQIQPGFGNSIVNVASLTIDFIF